MWVDFEYKENKFRVKIEYRQQKKFLRKQIDQYYKYEFNKNDRIFKRYTTDNHFNKNIYFNFSLDYILELSDNLFKEILINTAKEIIDCIYKQKETNENINNRIIEI